MPVTRLPHETNENAWRLDIVQWQIELKHHDIRQGFYRTLFQLYANIGRICSKHLKQHPVDSASVFEQLSDNLVKRYGKLFDTDQLKQMMLFAQQHQPHPLKDDRDLFCFNWNYLAVLLPVVDQQEQRFYMRATALKRWSVDELRKHIRADDFKNPKIFKGLKAQALRYPGSTGAKRKRLERQLSVWRLYGDLRNMPFPNPFTEPAVSDYQLLIQPPNDEPQFTYQQFDEGIKVDDLNSISFYIQQFREQVNRNLNHSFNDFLWNLGYSLLMPDPIDNIIIKTLRQLYGDFFTLDTIDHIKAYRSNVIDYDLQYQISFKLTWPHIVHLLPLESSEAQLFYAELADEEDLSATELQCRIKSNWYEQSLAADDKQKAPDHTIASKIQRHEEVQGKNIFVIYSTLINVNDNRPSHKNLNILQNPCFMQFMAVPLH